MTETLLSLTDASWAVTLELAPWLLLGAVVGGLLHGLVPAELIHRQLRGLGGVVRAVVLGVPLPLCSCGVIPAGVSLHKRGASNGASVGFLIATPQTGVDSALVAAGFLGWPFALYKVGAALVTGLVGGALVEVVDPGVAPAGTADDAHSDRSVSGMVAHALDLIRSIWGWLAFGIVASAALTVFVPPGSLSGLAGGAAVVALLLVLLASVPLYVCATASVPIAAALVEAGLPTGAALVFLMAGPATNVATLGAVWRTFGTRSVALYLGTLVVGSVGLGLAYEPLLGDLVALQTGQHAHTAWWAAASAVLLLGAFAVFAVQDAQSAVRRWQAGRTRAETQTVEVPVAGMTCRGCAGKVERALLASPGVTSVVVDLDPGRAVVHGTASLAQLRGTVEAAGFTVPDAPASAG